MAVSGSTSGRISEHHLTKSWHQETSPGRTRVWTEPGKSRADHRVPVVYYLSRNGQLEHPHFMEVPLSSTKGLFLGDVISRLNSLRGIGMASMYSWSCKRSYKNGFVWHDLSENDFIYPASGNEYVLKGSELLLDRHQPPPPPPLPSPENQTIAPADRRRRNQSCSSIDYDPSEYSVYKAEPFSRSAADASTQTDDGRRRRRKPPEIVEEKPEKEAHREEIEISPPPSDSSPETLETLLKVDGRSILAHPETVNKESTLNSNGKQIQKTATKSSVLMQLISCGSMSFRDCGAGQVISQYRMRVPRGGGGGGGGGGRVKVEEKEYFSGSIVETKKEEVPRLKRCSSYNADHR